MYEYSCKVEKVVDGDTCDVIMDLGFDILYKSRVRLYGIDTPESRTRNLDEKARGKMAAAYLEDAINNGNTVVIQTKLKDSRGKYGRVLGNVLVDDVNINEQMVDKHLAVKYFGQSKEDVEEEHLKNRQILIDNGTFEP